MGKILKQFKPIHWLVIIIMLALVCAEVYFTVTLPEYMGKLVGEVQAAGMGGTVDNIWSSGLNMLLYALGTIGTAMIVGFLAAYLATSISRNLREAVFNKVQDFSLAEINKFSTSSLITRTTNDITQVASLITTIFQLVLAAPITAVWAITKIVGKSGELSVVMGIGIVVLLSIMICMFIFVLPKFKLVQKQTDKLNSVTQENLSGLRVVRAYNAEGYEEEKFEKANKNITKTNLFINRAMGLMSPMMNLLLSGMTLGIVWLSAYLLGSGSIQFGAVTEFTQYVMIILNSFMMVAVMFIMIPRGQVSIKRIAEVLNTEVTVKDGEGVTQDSAKIGEVEFDKVSFKYPNAEDYVLKDISFKVKSGEVVAFVGSTGSGKSTLVNLIPRFYDVTSGAIFVDGTNVKDYKLKDLNDKLGYVPQKGFLFGGSIEKNIKIGCGDATKDEILNAIDTAQGTEFVSKLEGTTDYHISQGGKNVSGGQRQRLSIARAVVKRPEIYIFDDSFSALDYKTDRSLRAALKQQTSGATTFIVATRIGTILDADKIVVLENGRAAGIGTHKELMNSCSVYQEIAYSQLSKEELAA